MAVNTAKGYRSCTRCENFVSVLKKEDVKEHGIDRIGYCSEFNIDVIDTLCGCEDKYGQVVLRNF